MIVQINDKFLTDNKIDLKPATISIAESIKTKIISSCEEIHLQYCLLLSDSQRIELIKCFRLLEIFEPIVFQSFYPIDYLIKKDTTNLILVSKGVSFIQLPEYSFNKKITTEKADKQSLIPFFRAELDLVKIRHEMANLWGAERIKGLSKKTEAKIENYNIELLKFVNPIENIKKLSPPLFQKLENLKNWFHRTNPIIVYYDDQADLWGPVLKQYLGSKFHYYNTSIDVKELKKNFRSLVPITLLLDLRLKNEKEFITDPLKLSGGKLLVDFKKEFYTLPIVMFTATNKAESVRKLLSNGADYVWTKEGIDNGIDDEYTINNLINLLYLLKNNHYKFKTEIHKTIFEVENKINNYRLTNKTAKDKLQRIITQGYNTIIIDTNFLIDENNLLHLELFYSLLLANKEARYPLKVIIHNDVFREVFKNSQANGKKEIIEICKFLMRFLYKLTDEKLISIPLDFGDVLNVQKFAQLEISPLEKIELKRKSFFQNIVGFFNAEQEKDIEILNSKIENHNLQLKPFDGLKRIRLHADDTFKEWIPELLVSERDKNIIFISDDKNCSYEIGVGIILKFNLKTGDYDHYDFYVNQVPKTSLSKYVKRYKRITITEFYSL